MQERFTPQSVWSKPVVMVMDGHAAHYWDPFHNAQRALHTDTNLNNGLMVSGHRLASPHRRTGGPGREAQLQHWMRVVRCLCSSCVSVHCSSMPITHKKVCHESVGSVGTAREFQCLQLIVCLPSKLCSKLQIYRLLHACHY